MELTDREVAALTGGQDTRLHSHDFDRRPTHKTIEDLQNLDKTPTITADYDATLTDDFLYVDSTAGAININVPFNKRQRELTVVRVAGTFSVTLTATSPDTINGFGTLVITDSYVPVHIKGAGALGWVQV